MWYRESGLHESLAKVGPWLYYQEHSAPMAANQAAVALQPSDGLPRAEGPHLGIPRNSWS